MPLPSSAAVRKSREGCSAIAEARQLAQERYKERVQKVLSDAAADFKQRPLTPWDAMIGWYNYSVDFAQRSVLFWDTLRQRGNNFLKSTQEGLLAGAALRLRNGARRTHASRARSITRWCASCRRQA